MGEHEYLSSVFALCVCVIHVAACFVPLIIEDSLM